MYFADNIIRERIKNVYFLWGRGKTTIANELHRRYGYFIYDVDRSRNYHWTNSKDPINQPIMCRDYEEEMFLKEFSPMAIMDLILLSPKHDVIICEGDLECAPSIVSNAVYLLNLGTKFDWFDRPDHDNIRDTVNDRTDLLENKKEAIIKKAYDTVGQNEGKLPSWVIKNNIKVIAWDDFTSIEQTALEVAHYFGFCCVE